MPVDEKMATLAADPATFLATIDADWAALVGALGACGHQTKPERQPYEALVRAVAHQQLHANAAEAMLARLLALYPAASFPSPRELLASPSDALRRCGFSARKAATIHAIAAATQTGVVPDLATATGLPDDQLIAQLVTLPGIGRWTVEMFLIYSLGRADILPADDFGVREGYRLLKSLDHAPSPKAMGLLGQPWSPHRTAAAWYLWRVPRPPATRVIRTAQATRLPMVR